MNPLKIGILLNPDRELLDMEVRIFSNILTDPRYEVVCTIKDGRNLSNKKSIRQKFLNAILGGYLSTALLMRIINCIENPLKKGARTLPYNSAEIREKIRTLPSLKISPLKKGFLDIFSTEDCTELESFNLDVLLRHEFGIIRGAILNIPKYGIWSFHHADNKVNRGGPPGFWEVYNNSSVTGVTLQVLEDELDGGKIIQKGFYNTSIYWYLNYELILEKSVDLILKHLGLLYENRELKCTPSTTYSNKLFKAPSFSQALNYILKTYSGVIYRKIERVVRPIVKRADCKNVWKLHIGKGNVENSVLWRTKTIEPPRNEFWADPFLFEYESKLYIFFENYEYSKRKGKISVGIFKEDQIVEVSDAIEVDYHLSYPFLFEHNKSIFMIPETSQSKRIEIWKCNNFPNNWSLEKTCFEGVCSADSTIAKDINGKFWLFTNMSFDKFCDHNSHLYVFQIDSPMMNKIIPHKLNPVITDCRFARNAGEIYIDKSGRLIRPSQGSQDGIYGKYLQFCHIKELTINTYNEEIIETIRPEFKDGLIATHHVSQTKGLFVIDGCYQYR